MSIFNDLFDSLTGQKKAAPYNPLSVQDTINQSVPMAANATVAYNDILQPAYTRQGLASSNTVNPYANDLEKSTTKAILDQLNLGGELPDEIKQQVQRSALQSGVASGLGISPAGRTVVARDLGLTGLDLLNQRIGRAASFAPVATSMAERFYKPQTAFTPEDVFGGLQSENAAQNQRAAEEFARTEGNKIAMFNTGGRILGGVAGGIFGGPMGAQLGSSIGGSIFQNPYTGQNSGGAGGNGFASILNSGQGMGMLDSIFGKKGGFGGTQMTGPDYSSNPLMSYAA